MQNIADDVASPHAPLLENREDIIARPKSVPKLYVPRLLVIYAIFSFHLCFVDSALFSSVHAPDNQYTPPSLPPWLYIVSVTLTTGLWLRLASPSACGPKRVTLISIAGMFVFAIAVLIYLQYFIMSYSATCIIHVLNGLLGGNLVFGALVYAQLADVITRPLSRFATFSFVMGLDFLLHSVANMVVFSLFGFTLNEGTIKVPAWIVCLLIPVVHIALVHVLLPESQASLHHRVDHTWKVVLSPLTVLVTPKRLLVMSSALIIYTITQSFSPVKGMLVLAHHHLEAQSFIFLFFAIPPLATLVLFLVLLPGGTFVYMHTTTRKPAQYRSVRIFTTWSLLFDIASFIVVPILVHTTSSTSIPLVVAGLSALTDGVRPALYVLLSAVPSAQLFGGVRILEIVAQQVSLEVTTRTIPWQKIDGKDERKLLAICGVLVILLALVVGLVNYASDVDETAMGQSGLDAEDEETSALAPPAAIEDSP